MAKSHKTKKHLKSEKAKTKLKVKDSKTKFLPKGGNVTDVNFKIKPIVIREQLKSHSEDEVLSRRKLNIKDLLSRLKHYNTNVKTEAIQDLIEIFSSFSEEPVSLVIESYISQILQHTCSLILDKEKNVRHKAIKLISLILSTVEKDKITPFSNIILSHLKCAMTDIDKKVQADSLSLMDSLVIHFPQLIVENSNQILPIFLILISKVKDSSSQRKVLSINLQGSSTSIKWRIQVLNRLQRVLNIVNINKKETSSSNFQEKNHQVDNKFYFPIYNDLWNDYPFNSSFITNFGVRNEEDTNKSSFPGYINALVPLLYDTWLEAIPEKNLQSKGDEGTVLNQEEASILKSILNIFYLVWQYVTTDENSSFEEMAKLFSNKAGKRFLNLILTQFPYSQSQTVIKEKGKESKDILQLNKDLKCVEINLLVCYMFCKINKKISQEWQKNEAEKVLQYLKICLLNRNFIKEENTNSIIAVIRIIIFENSPFWGQKQLNILEIIDSFVHFFENTAFSEEHNKAVLDILCNVTQNTFLNRSERFQKWLGDLPLLLCKNEVSVSVINTVSLLARQNNSQLHDGLLKYLPDILENLSKIRVANEEQETYIFKIMSSYFYIVNGNEDCTRWTLEIVENYADLPVGKILKKIISLCH